MLEIEIDGKKVEVADGSTVMDAANKAGTFIPHFCYHKKLSIAANCRMCLVDVEKAPKALPACATPVTPGMKVITNSEKAVKAQKAVMEFLLINHPLDCPICDQGGECQLQDLAVGYGGTGSRYREEKRVVFNKNLGPLINTDMTRCIHCTRCVRFGQEIAGVMELGVANRGEHSEIMTFLGRSVDSELSGNVIDLCPVGALTSKPFRFSARTWEMARRRSVSPHDSLGSNLIIQVKHDEVKRVLPLENEAVNECWISDKDRFSYEGLQAADRIMEPQVKHGGVWHKVDWSAALDYVVRTLQDIKNEFGANQIGALISPHCTVEEMFLAQKLMRGLGSNNVDFRLRQSDFSLDEKRVGVPWLGTQVAALSKLDSALVIGSFVRKDHPLIAQRLRQAVRRGAKLSRVHVAAEDWFIPIAAEAITTPSGLASALGEVLAALVSLTGMDVAVEYTESIRNLVPGDAARAIADKLLKGESRAVLLGNLAIQHPHYSSLHALAGEIARLANATLGVLGEASGTVGGYIAGALPRGGLNAHQMLASSLKAYVVVGAELPLDAANGVAARAALEGAGSVIYLGSFAGSAPDYADVILPIAPFAETSGTYINTEGRPQSFAAVVKARGDARPAWKVLRVLANLLGLDGFDYESSDDVRDAVLKRDISTQLSNALSGVVDVRVDGSAGDLERIADVPIHFADPLSRRAPSLQETRDAEVPSLRVSRQTADRIGVDAGHEVRVTSASGFVQLKVVIDNRLPSGAARVAAAHPSTVALGSLFGELGVERV